jgi:4a-hydroxytetrahydrobiopterin dehydratase
MARPQPLSPAQIDTALADLPGWTHADGRLRRSFVFANFVEAFAFMTRVAFAAERLDHHPDWTNVWSRVDVLLWTHDCGGITTLDLELARAMNLAA